jgi:glutaryl-CoA dehydrogenase
MDLRTKDAPGLGRFNWEDPLRFDSQLTEEERMLSEAVPALIFGRAITGAQAFF